MDGFSYKYINKKNWNIYREPLFNCANKSLEDQTLPDTFMTAQIKLIPKKGDCKKIGNWRLISFKQLLQNRIQTNK